MTSIDDNLEKLLVNYVDDLAGKVDRAFEGRSDREGAQIAFDARNMFFNAYNGHANRHVLRGIGDLLEGYAMGREVVSGSVDSEMPMTSAARYIFLGATSLVGGGLLVLTGFSLAKGGELAPVLFTGVLSAGLLYISYRIYRNIRAAGPSRVLSVIKPYAGFPTGILEDEDRMKEALENKRDYVSGKLNLLSALSLGILPGP